MRADTKTYLILAAGIALVAAAAFATAVFGAMELRAHPSAAGPSALDKPTYDNDGFPEVDWAAWQEVNPDICAWITIPGTNVDLPVVQASADSPTYYLTHDVYGNYNVYGAVYVDAGCEQGTGSEAPILFGHNMDDGTMFADVAKYTDWGFADEHTRVLIQTPLAKYALGVRSAVIVPGWEESKRTAFTDHQDLESWYGDYLTRADMTLDKNPHLTQAFTLITCSYNRFANERTLVFAAPIDTYEQEK